MRTSATARRVRPEAIRRRRRRVARGVAGIVALVLLAPILADVLDGEAPPVSPAAANADVTPAGPAYANARQVVPVSGDAVSSGAKTQTCPLVARSTGYVNPLARARVKRERIDQGVDYAGSGTLTAIGAARVTHVATDATGWPGAFIEYRLLDGPDRGCYVFYAEGVTPEPGLHVGDRIHAGQALATIIPDHPTGFEVGWGAGAKTKTYAAVTTGWTADDDEHNHASAAGKNFSSLIASLGGPPGKVEG